MRDFAFETNRERLDIPLHCALFRHPLGAACAGLELGWVGVTGHRHQNGNVVGSGAALKLTPRLQKTTPLNKTTRSLRCIWRMSLGLGTPQPVMLLLGGCRRQMASTAEIRCVINTKWSSVKGLDEWIRTQYFVRVCVTYLHLDLHTTVRELLNHAFNPYERLHLSVEESERTRSEGWAQSWTAPWWHTSPEWHSDKGTERVQKRK